MLLALILADAPVGPTDIAAARLAPAPLLDRPQAPTRSEDPTLPVFAVPDAAPTPEPATPMPTASAVIAASSTLYRITVPRLGIDLLIKEGDIKRDIDDQNTPINFAFHLPGTMMPGQGGNTYLYAHARTGMFLSLWNARPGDEVFIAAPGGQLFAYVVREVLARVAPTDVSSAQPTSTERLTLQTSTGPNASDPRFVVVALPRGS